MTGLSQGKAVYTCLFIMLLCLTASYCSVAQTQPSKIYTLEDAVKTALQKNPDLVSAKLEVERADARVSEAWGSALPSVNVAGQYVQALKKPVFFLPDFSDLKSGRIVPIEIGTKHSMNMTVSATQILFNSAVITGVGAAKIYSGAARDLYNSKKLEIIAKVRKAYYGVLMAGEAQAMMRSNLKNAEENLRNVQRMSKQGLVSEYDELRASVGVENLRPIVIQSENNYALALDGLRGAMGIETKEAFDVQGKLQFEAVDEAIIANAMETVLKANYTLMAVRHQHELGQAAVNIQRSGFFPTLAAFGNYQYQMAKNDFVFSTNDFIGSSQVGLSLSINLFDGLQTNARVEQAQLDVAKSQEQLTGLETNLRTAAHSVALQLRQAKQRIDAQGKTVEQAERGYKIATTRFTSGSGTQLEVNDAQLALTQAQVNRIQAVYDYLVASADLDQLLGRFPTYVTDTHE